MWPSVSRMMPEPRPCCCWFPNGLLPVLPVVISTTDGRTASYNDVKSDCVVSGFGLELADVGTDALPMLVDAFVVDFELLLPPRAHVTPPTVAAPIAMLSTTMTNVLPNRFMADYPRPL